jgi:hypothetical protein
MQARIVAAAVALAAPLAARAGPGLEIAFRSGFELPFGDIASGAPLSDSFHGFVPLGLELGVRYTPELSAAVSFGYAVGLAKNCPGNSSCSGQEITLGLDFRYHLLSRDRVDPWVGIGAGFEWLGLSQTTGGTSADARVNGFEYVHAQMGVDLAASDKVRLGPYVQLGLGEYRSATVSAGGLSASGDFVDKALHEFLTLGLRVSFLP